MFAETTQHRVDVNRLSLSRRRAHKNKSVLFSDWNRDQPASRAIESFKTILIGNRDQVAVGVVGPRMIRTRKSLSADPATIDQLRPTIPTNVHKRPQLARRIPYDGYRHP